jgi:outer membrane biogenesis lipoprotein LolB
VGNTLAVLLLSGCFSACGSRPNLNGNWQFTLKSLAYGSTYTATGSIAQTSQTTGSIGAGTDSVSGTVNLANDPCATTAPLSGTITGSNVMLTITEDNEGVSLTGSVNAAFTAMSGSYTTPAGGCTNADFGSWSASKS